VRAVNLIPAEQRSGAGPGAGRSGGAAYAVLATIGGLAILALLYGLAHKEISDKQSQVASLQVRAQRAERQATALASYTTFAQMRQQRVAAVEALVDSRFDWAHVMHEFGRVLPAGVSITSLTGSVGSTLAGGAPKSALAPAASSSATSSGAGSSSSGSSSSASTGSGSATSATPPGSVPTFQITGCTRTQTKVAETLNHLRLMDGVSEVTLQSSTKTGGATGSAGAAGGCPTDAAIFSVNVTFQPLPSASASAAAAAPHTSVVSAK
jgi:hypothetical protein